MTVSLEIKDGLGFVGLNAPPVNGLSLAVRSALLRIFTRLRERREVTAIVLYGAGRGFSAGGEISEFGTPAAGAEPGLSQHVHPAIEDCGKPVIAAAHGFLVGGGLETALACHYRLAEAGTKVALPEGKLGIIPLAATQRLPRLVGLEAAFELMLNGRTCLAEAGPAGLFDRIAEPGRMLEAAAELAREVVARGAPHPAVRDLPPPRDDAEAILARLRGRLEAAGAPLVAWRLLDAVAACVEAPTFEAGMARARTIHDELKDAPDVASARDAFFAGRATPTRDGGSA